MKTSFAVLGIIFIVIVVVGGIAFGTIAMRENPMDAFSFWFLTTRGDTLNHESKVYADTVIPAIFGTGGEREVLEREGPEFKQSVTQQQLDQLFQRIAALGHLQKCDPAEGQSIMSARTHTIKAEYNAKA